MGHSANHVRFASSAQAAREADDEEYDVMNRFSKHASHCAQCIDPVRSGALCDSGNKYAREVASYVYIKNGKAYSVVDRQCRNEKIQIEVPANCAVIKKLCQAVDRGLTLKRENATVVVDNRATKSRPVPRESREDYEVVTVRPSSSREERRRYDGREKRSSEKTTEKRKETVYVKGRGSLYKKDEAERRLRDEEQPIIINAAPRGQRYIH
jgi:hypothetical protein